jgi:hypothetical protein
MKHALALAGAATLVACASAAVAEQTVSFVLPDHPPSNLVEWMRLALELSGAASMIVAWLPQGRDGGWWDKTRTALNWIAHNYRNARNQRLV